MLNFLHTVGLTASLVALVAGLWQDWSFWTTVTRMSISYLGFFCLALVLAMTLKVLPARKSGRKPRPYPGQEYRGGAGTP